MTTSEELREWASRVNPLPGSLESPEYDALYSWCDHKVVLTLVPVDTRRTFALLVACAMEDDDADQA